MSESNGKVDLKLTRIDPRKLKLRELAEIEQTLGRKIGTEISSGDLGIDTMQALLWLELRKQDPAATFEDAGEYDLGQLSDAFVVDDEDGSVDPTRTPLPASDGATSDDSPGRGNSKGSRRSAVSTG
jgi:hypothetical protein